MDNLDPYDAWWYARSELMQMFWDGLIDGHDLVIMEQIITLEWPN